MLTAWGDESQSNRVLDPGTYILAAVVTLDEDLDAMRQAMMALRLAGSAKVHWRTDSDTRHRKIVADICQLPVAGVVVIRQVSGEDSKRSRRKCLEVLLAELQEFGCRSLTLESRGRADDRRDVETTRHLQRRRQRGSDVRLFHEVGPKEPLVWIADALCGAVVQDRCGSPANLAQLAQHLDIRVVDA